MAGRKLPTIAGISLDPDLHRQVGRAGRNLRAVASNAALRLHRDGQPEREVVQYLQHYGLATEAEATKRFSFINDRLWRPYVFTYSVGRELMSAWLDRLPEASRLDGYPPPPDRTMDTLATDRRTGVVRETPEEGPPETGARASGWRLKWRRFALWFNPTLIQNALWPVIAILAGFQLTSDALESWPNGSVALLLASCHRPGPPANKA